MHIVAYMMSCAERDLTRAQTLANLRLTDWGDEARVEMDQGRYERNQARQEDTAYNLLRRAIADQSPLILFLEDDLEFNSHLRHNLAHWLPVHEMSPSGYFFGSLYNPSVQPRWTNPGAAYFVAEPEAVYGSQAFLLSMATAEHIADHWGDVIGGQDIKMSRLAAQVSLIYYHVPSLVQHVGTSTWGGVAHYTPDFDREWMAEFDTEETAMDLNEQFGLVDRIIDTMRPIDGWFHEDEARLLIEVVARAARELGGPWTVVEVGSYLGRSTVVLGGAVAALRPDARVYAIDPHEGQLSVLGTGTEAITTMPTADIFTANIAAAGLVNIVHPIQLPSYAVAWDQAIGVLFIDGLHDYDNVSRDFRHFEPWLLSGGYTAFHDYASFAGVAQFVDEVLREGHYHEVARIGTMIVVRRVY
jgi:hypothetical protein